MTTTTSLVTGGCGFVGHHLVELLCTRGHRVRVLDCAKSPRPHADVDYRLASVLDSGAVRQALEGVDCLYHLAANPNLWALDKGDFERVNYEGTRIVLAEAERAGLDRVVYTSTESILKRRGGNGHIDETVTTTLADMPGPYCRSKFLGEQAARDAARRGLPVVIVNPTLPVGAGDHWLTPPSKMLLMFLNGSARAYLDFEVNMIDVGDVATGHLLAAERGQVGERYIIGNANVRMSELLRLLEELTGLDMPTHRVSYLTALAAGLVSELVADYITRRPPAAPLTGVRLAGRRGSYDSSRAVHELGLPQTPLSTALTRAVTWFAEQGMLRRAPPRLAR